MTRTGNTSAGGSGPGEPRAISLPAPTHEHLAELERRSLLAEQARQLAHALRSPLSVIGLISETLQVDLAGDGDKRRRLDQVIEAVTKLSTTLTDTVSSARFADGPQQPVDVAAVAADIVQLHGGRAERDNEIRPVLIEPDGFEAAMMLALRLIGHGDGSNGGQPVLRCSTEQDSIRLVLSVDQEGRGAHLPGRLTPDRTLMVKAAERVARDHGGTLALESDQISFDFPLARV